MKKRTVMATSTVRIKMDFKERINVAPQLIRYGLKAKNWRILLVWAIYLPTGIDIRHKKVKKPTMKKARSLVIKVIENERIAFPVKPEFDDADPVAISEDKEYWYSEDLKNWRQLTAQIIKNAKRLFAMQLEDWQRENL